MLRTFTVIAVSLAAMSLTTPASAVIRIFANTLGPEALGATGTGYAQATYDTTTQMLAVQTNWSGLSGTTTVAHIHCCVATPGTGTVGIAVTPNTFPGFPVGTTSGTYSDTLNLNLSTTFTSGFLNNFGGGTVPGGQAALLSGLANGRAYLNIHTTAFPGGEIRAFLHEVPEPETWALMVVGFGLLGGAIRHSRRRPLAPA